MAHPLAWDSLDGPKQDDNSPAKKMAVKLEPRRKAMTLLEELKQLYDGLPQAKRLAVANAIRSCPDCGGNCDGILEAIQRELKHESKAD